MSDFDKEAERERLREKYEDDRRERQSTQRMSELLLKGATMTDQHCETCGDPIFRYDGQMFCPTCRSEGEAAADSASEAGGDSAGTDEAGERPDEAAVEVETPASDADDARAAGRTPAPPDSPAAGRPDATGDRTTARASLERTLVRFAREAEAAEDPRRARDLLAAAREAAETLAVLDRR